MNLPFARILANWSSFLQSRQDLSVCDPEPCDRIESPFRFAQFRAFMVHLVGQNGGKQRKRRNNGANNWKTSWKSGVKVEGVVLLQVVSTLKQCLQLQVQVMRATILWTVWDTNICIIHAYSSIRNMCDSVTLLYIICKHIKCLPLLLGALPLHVQCGALVILQLWQIWKRSKRENNESLAKRFPHE